MKTWITLFALAAVAAIMGCQPSDKEVLAAQKARSLDSLRQSVDSAYRANSDWNEKIMASIAKQRAKDMYDFYSPEAVEARIAKWNKEDRERRAKEAADARLKREVHELWLAMKSKQRDTVSFDCVQKGLCKLIVPTDSIHVDDLIFRSNCILVDTVYHGEISP